LLFPPSVPGATFCGFFFFFCWTVLSFSLIQPPEAPLKLRSFPPCSGSFFPPTTKDSLLCKPSYVSLPQSFLLRLEGGQSVFPPLKFIPPDLPNPSTGKESLPPEYPSFITVTCSMSLSVGPLCRRPFAVALSA